jgi:hypothetical protein
MSFPSSHHTPGGSAANGVTPSGPPPTPGAVTAAPARPVVVASARQASGGLPRSTACRPLPAEGDHQLEKLEFALAIALTRGDAQRSRQLREEIDRLGGNREEPGT